LGKRGKFLLNTKKGGRGKFPKEDFGKEGETLYFDFQLSMCKVQLSEKGKISYGYK
jgi:hypothetical protein